MNQNTLNSGRMALNGVAAAAILMCSINASALGLGRLAVQSAIGETLKAEIEVTSLTPEEASNLKVNVAKPDAYRAAGVDYNAILPSTQVVLQRRADGRTFLKITSDRAVQEPFVDVILELSWSTGRLVREYTMLLDPPTTRIAAPAEVAVEPVMSAAQPIAPVVAQAPVSSRRTPAAVRAPEVKSPDRPAPTSTPTPVDAPSAGSGSDQYTVRPGDTLSRIAGRVLKPGVSLDQMLVSLYRGNPRAFVDSNMNRLRSGVVLSVPSADAAKALSTDDARQVILAQSTDFNSFRQRLAGTVPAAQADASPRQAKGAVQATVDDKKPAAVQAPDKLTLSSGASAGATKSVPEEEKISKEKEKQAAAARAAELSKNVEELKKLANAASASVSAAAPVPSGKAANGGLAAPPSSGASAVLTLPVPVAVPSEPMAASQSVSGASTADVAASEPLPAAMTPSAPASVVAPVSPPAPAEPGLTDRLLGNSMGLVLGGVLVALLAGFGFYRLSKRSKSDSGETSFLESRLQPDSFFGASGGQRIDTRDATGASSSMSYSLSQLDAIGDVDPVAEADVYLAYGRDLQAEEILKEAMRGNPDRLAIRTKLLEVYAKRRDTKGFESLATQLFSLTQGVGEDWAKAQEIGLQIDPDNPLYQPGGSPGAVDQIGSSGPEESHSVPPSIFPEVAAFDATRSRVAAPAPNDLNLDLELDLAANSGSTGMPTVPGVLDSTPLSKVDFDFGVDKPAVADSAPSPLDFDLGAISLDLDAPPAATEKVEDVDTGSDEDDGRDPLERKLDLAEEFRQIGDLEGARDLLQEVVDKATGSLRSKAQSMLSSLS